MTSLAIQSFKGQSIRIRKEDRYVCLTDMAKASGKRYPDWSRLDGTKSYLETLSTVVHISTAELIEVNQGGAPESQGTWGHPKVALRFAQWCSDEFAVQVDLWIDELLTTGKVELNKEPLPVALPPADIRVTNLICSLTALGIELTNPRIKQGLQDLTLDLLGLTKSLPSAVPIDIWAGVAERAEELGYAPGLVVQYRSQLGKYVKSFSLESKQEKRLCNGTQRPINIYKVSDDLDNAIKEFMDAKVLAS